MKLNQATLVNLTPHPIRLWRDGKVVASWDKPADETRIPRVTESKVGEHVLLLDSVSIPVTHLHSSRRLHPVPPVVEGVVYVVSRLSAQAVTHRRDILFPVEHRDKDGNIDGCSGFATFFQPDGHDLG